MWKKTIGYYVCIGCICLSYYSGLGLLFHLDFVRSLSDAWYYFWLAIATACHVALLTFVIYKHKEKLIIVKPRFKWSYLGYSVAGYEFAVECIGNTDPSAWTKSKCHQ